ncbi:MAG TPA: GNAT family N-acetyltransferase [Solirubrobacteraceae bacterium]|nr:GNAT family N-acetyltransferase [Solirubrobacteraceae bacterium]
MECVELAGLTGEEWTGLLAGEERPWGAVPEGLQWRQKERFVGLRAPDGRHTGIAGAVVATVEVEGTGSFEVVGVGSVFVTRAARGRGLVFTLLERLLSLAEELGPERAMLFCRPELATIYRRVAFAEIGSPVQADQQGRPVEVPMTAMWRALRVEPAGRQGRSTCWACLSDLQAMLGSCHLRAWNSCGRSWPTGRMATTARPSGRIRRSSS